VDELLIPGHLLIQFSLLRFIEGSKGLQIHHDLLFFDSAFPYACYLSFDEDDIVKERVAFPAQVIVMLPVVDDVPVLVCNEVFVVVRYQQHLPVSTFEV